MKDTGLSEDTVSKLVGEIRKCEKVEEIILYGSRAKGTYKKFSDIDMTLKGKGLKREDLYPILEGIDDLYLPYEIDLSIYSDLDYQPLVDEIDRYGIRLG
ncbi:MAG: nucleotidyltransferase domain-containing protein [Muribaculaceae bacterium]|nr:nucleotidyltransferase domain-containing protein [Muribaculaceae bacterium]